MMTVKFTDESTLEIKNISDNIIKFVQEHNLNLSDVRMVPRPPAATDTDVCIVFDWYVKQNDKWLTIEQFLQSKKKQQ